MTINDIKTPYFVLELNKLDNNVKSFKEALNMYFPSNILGYSVKTNSTPALLALLLKRGCFAEVVSYDEFRLALKIGFRANQIIYNGPMKDKETFLYAVENGSYVNIDTKREIEWLKELPHDKLFKVGLRLNLNLMYISPEDCKDGEFYSRFGFSDENTEFGDAINNIKSLGNLKIVGLHLHRTSKTRSVDVYKNICNYAIKVIKKYNIQVEYLDLGGGYYGDMPGKPSYNDYISVMAASLKNDIDVNNITLLIEPGNAIIASPFTFFTSVIDTKKIGDETIVVLDGSRNDVDPFFRKKDYFKTLLVRQKGRNILPKQVCVGCTCLENDRMFELDNNPQLQIGDKIKLSFVGAYTTCLSPLFIRYYPKIYIQAGNKFTLSRASWTEKEYIQGSII